MRKEYDFTDSVRNPYAKRFRNSHFGLVGFGVAIGIEIEIAGNQREFDADPDFDFDPDDAHLP